MKQYMKNYELKNAAKDKLEGKYGPAVLICFMNFLLTSGATLLLELFLPAGSSLPVYVIQTVATLILAWVLGVMGLGLDFFFLKAACGQPCAVSDLFYGYQNDFTKALTISGVYALLSVVCEVPFQYMAAEYFLTGSDATGIAALITGIIGLCIYMPVTAGLALSYYLMLDFPDKSAKEVLALSLRLMKGSKRRIIYMYLSFIPLILLCVCSLYIGFLWLIPYMRMTSVCFFLDIMNPKVAEQA